MALPSLVAPEYKITIPSTGQDITYRPFLVKEEKLLLMAGESDSQEDQLLAVANVLGQCILTPDIAVGDLAPFDMEYLFLNLRSKSVGEVIKLNLTHTTPDGPTGTLESTCKHVTEYEFNVEDVTIPGPIPETKIQLTDDVGVVLRFPTFQDLAIVDAEVNTELMFDMMSDCIEYVYDKENVYDDFTKQEMSDWVGSLSQAQFEKISDFFNSMPKVEHDIEWKCTNCGKTDSIHLEGMQSFFT